MDPGAASDGRLAAMLDEARRSDAAAERTRRRWLQEQAAADARLSGVLVDAAEHGDRVAIKSVSGGVHTGRVVTVGSDMVAVRTAGGEALIKLVAVAVVHPDVTRRPAAAHDDRPGPDTRSLVDVVSERVSERPRVAIGAATGDRVVGRLVAVGADVATLELEDGRGVVYVSLESATEVSFLASG